MAEITVIANQKGGIGKTTTANALCAGLKAKGYSVLSVDSDPQGNLSHTMKADTRSRGLFEAMNGEDVSQLIQHTSQGDIISSSPQLTGADKKFTEYGSEYLLKEALSAIKDKYQYIIIDSPPQLGILTINALIAGNGLIIPCTSDLYAIMGLSQLLNTVERVKKHGNPGLIISGILLTRYTGRSVLSRDLKESIEAKAKEMGTKLYSAVIRENVSIREAQTSRQDIFSYAPKSNAAIDYNDFISEYLTDERSQKHAE
jgi:chromosome partitioning protein